MDSLLGQEFKDFEVLVVDQNRDERIVPLLELYHSQLKISRIATPGRHGISSGRNDGWRHARGDVVIFPDDDCWYPPWFLRRGVEVLDATGAELVSGRFADENGRSINGRFASGAQFITRRTVWITQSESATFYCRELLERLGGFDEELGIGSASPWQAAEGPDLILKALKRGYACYYDPSLYGFHREYDLDDPTEGMTRRGRMYGRGMGYVLRRHRYGFPTLLHWTLRPLVTAFISAICGRIHRVAYSLSVSVGRAEGWTGCLWHIGMSPDDRVLTSQTLVSGTTATDQHIESRSSFGKRRREMTGPYRARNPLMVGAALHSGCPCQPSSEAAGGDQRGPPIASSGSELGPSRRRRDYFAAAEISRTSSTSTRTRRVNRKLVPARYWRRADIAARIHVIDHWHLDRSNKSISRKIAQYLTRRRSLVHELSQCRYDMSIDTFASIPSTHGITWSADYSPSSWVHKWRTWSMSHRPIRLGPK